MNNQGHWLSGSQTEFGNQITSYGESFPRHEIDFYEDAAFGVLVALLLEPISSSSNSKPIPDGLFFHEKSWCSSADEHQLE
jgi:hypothetical protein